MTISTTAPVQIMIEVLDGGFILQHNFTDGDGKPGYSRSVHTSPRKLFSSLKEILAATSAIADDDK